MNDIRGDELVIVFAALASERRRQIVYTLGLRPASIKQLADQQKLSLPAIHRHIKVLEEAKLVTRKKSGRVNFLALNRNQLMMMQDWIRQYHTYWGNQHETLENYVASMEKDEAKLTKENNNG